MTDATLRIGCQTYTWEMLGDAFKGDARDLTRMIAEGGYEGIEITDTMIGDFASAPADFARQLADVGLTLAAFGFGSSSGFTQRGELDRDLDTTRRWLDFVARFPGAVLSLGSATVVDSTPRDEMFAVAAEFYNKAWQLGSAAGVTVAIHPSSHDGTLLLTRKDYDDIFARLDAQVGWVPDTGHILRGGQTMADTLAAFHERIRYVHLKDVDAHGTWSILGKGTCDVPAVIAAARKAPHFNGWVVVEEESEESGKAPAVAVKNNRDTMRRLGF